MIKNWKIEMVKEVNRIVHDSSISSTVREEGIRQVHEWYRLARHVSTSRLNAIESTKDNVEKWLTGLIEPSSHEQDEAANQVYIADCHCRECEMMTHVQKTQLMGLARSFLEDPSTANNPSGHESRLIAMAEVCKTNRLPNEIILMVLALVQPIDMARVRFTGSGEKRWLSAEDVESMEAEKAARAAPAKKNRAGTKAASRTGVKPRWGHPTPTLGRRNATSQSSTCGWASSFSSSAPASTALEVKARGRVDFKDGVWIRDDDGLCFPDHYTEDEGEDVKVSA